VKHKGFGHNHAPLVSRLQALKSTGRLNAHVGPHCGASANRTYPVTATAATRFQHGFLEIYFSCYDRFRNVNGITAITGCNWQLNSFEFVELWLGVFLETL